MKFLIGALVIVGLLQLSASFDIPIEGDENGDYPYLIGTGIHDITGPAAEFGFMGYAMLNQRTKGVHFRLRSRAFVFADAKNTENRVVFVNMDLCMATQPIKDQVVERLQSALPNGPYNQQNVMISGTHTHAGPGGFHSYMLYDITTLGYNKEHVEMIVDSVTQSILKAHENANKESRLLMNTGKIDGANINRSKASYKNNPAAELAKYTHDTDHDVTVLRMEDKDQTELGMVNWFAVHCTSMNNTNDIISGDNKGYAAMLFEKEKNPGALPGKGPFVGAFAQANEGDVSPNTRGPSCPDGSPCDDVHSTCDGRTQGCIAKGPGKTDFESVEIIGRKQYEAVSALYAKAKAEISGPIDSRHAWVAMNEVQVDKKYTSTGRDEHTCDGAMGDSFAAGTTDGPGEFTFIQGSNGTGNPFFNFIGSFLSKPTEAQKKCQYPKPIFLNTGKIELKKDMYFTPQILPIQIIRIGTFYIAAVPGEFTTMSGRRLRKTIYDTLVENGASKDSVVVIAGLSNSYSGYIATYEEFNIQRYEGASTLFGPHTLAAYQQEFAKLAKALATGTPVPSGPKPPRPWEGTTIDLQPPVVVDGPIFSTKKFGKPLTDARESYVAGDMVVVVFQGAHLRNNYMTEKSFMTVEQKQTDGSWAVVCDDGCWETKVYWARWGMDESKVTTTWEIPKDTPGGTYRIRNFGYYKHWNTYPYEGSSREFTVSARRRQ